MPFRDEQQKHRNSSESHGNVTGSILDRTLDFIFLYNKTWSSTKFSFRENKIIPFPGLKFVLTLRLIIDTKQSVCHALIYNESISQHFRFYPL